MPFQPLNLDLLSPEPAHQALGKALFYRPIFYPPNYIIRKTPSTTSNLHMRKRKKEKFVTIIQKALADLPTCTNSYLSGFHVYIMLTSLLHL
jgi:hypothetical protein